MFEVISMNKNAIQNSDQPRKFIYKTLFLFSLEITAAAAAVFASLFTRIEILKILIK
jgi:hypothetical protein